MCSGIEKSVSREIDHQLKTSENFARLGIGFRIPEHAYIDMS